MSDSEDENIEESVETVEQPKTEATFDRKSLPKHMKQRYWNSWEEMRLIELWRQHFSEVTDLEHNLPIFRTIGAGLRESGFHMNAQEVRRKIKTMKNKYIQESRYIREHGGISEWRLYRLMHCMMTTNLKNCDLDYMKKQLAAVAEKNCSEPLFHILASGMPVNETLQRIGSGEHVDIPKPVPFEVDFPIENKSIAASIICAFKNKHRLSFTPRVFRHNYEIAEQTKRYDDAMKSLSSTIIIRPDAVASPHPQSISPPPEPSVDTFSPISHPKQHRTKFMNGKGILKFRVSEHALEKIRAQNRNLMEEVVLATRKLKQEEQQLKNYEHMVAEVKSFLEKMYENQ